MAVRFSKLYTEQGIDAPLIGLNSSFVAERALKDSVEFLGLEKKSSALSKVRNIIAILDQKKSTHLFVHRFKDLKVVFLIKKMRPHIKVIAWAHIFIDYKKKDVFHKMIYSCVDQLVCMTETHKDNLLKSLPISESKLKIVPLGIDLSRFAVDELSEQHKQQRKSLRSQLGCNETTFLIGSAGRFDPQKGQIELIEAARLLKNYIDSQETPILEDFKLVLVGEDTQGEPGTKAHCERLIEEYGLHDHVQILGFMEQIQVFYRSLDLFVMPSYQETFGLVLIEAMASGCPCMSTYAGGPIDILNRGELGLLVEPKSEQALFKGLLEVFKNRKVWKQKAVASKKKALDEYNEESLIKNLRQLILN